MVALLMNISCAGLGLLMVTKKNFLNGKNSWNMKNMSVWRDVLVVMKKQSKVARNTKHIFGCLTKLKLKKAAIHTFYISVTGLDHNMAINEMNHHIPTIKMLKFFTGDQFMKLPELIDFYLVIESLFGWVGPNRAGLT